MLSGEQQNGQIPRGWFVATNVDMNVIALLGREHRLFEKLIERMRKCDEMSPEEARRRIVESLVVLLPALDRHDAIEDLVFGKMDGLGPQEAQARALVDAQHSGLRELRSELQSVLSNQASATLTRLKGLAELMAQRLTWHLNSEEMLLWPFHAKRASRSLSRSVRRKAEESVRDLEASVASLSKAFREYVGGMQ